MRILVLNPPFLKKFSRPQRSPAVTKSGTLYYPIWLAYCVGVLEDEGHAVTFIDAPARGLGLGEIIEQAKATQPYLIVMDTSTPSIENDIHIAEKLKNELPQSYIVMVGTHVSALPEETLRRGKFIDAVARREYEYTIREIASLLADNALSLPRNGEFREILGLSFRLNGRIIHNPDRPFIENLDELPWVSMIYKKYLQTDD